MGAILPGDMLTEQHRKIDVGIKGIADGNGEIVALAESLDLLRLHLYVEETLLFPPLVTSGLAMPIFVMKREHGQMWPLLQALQRGCASAAPIDALREPARQLFQLLQIHNGKEEQIVYTAADRLADDDPDGALVTELTATEVPADWVCEMGGARSAPPRFAQPAG